jgi:hypothetical protein
VNIGVQLAYDVAVRALEQASGGSPDGPYRTRAATGRRERIRGGLK